jgi:predicted GH43/DUF377 family glycosyl hydrolase
VISNRGELFVRHPKNPILTVDDLPVPANSVFNSGAIKTREGRYVMVLRVEDLDRKQHFRLATSEDGVAWSVARQAIEFEQDAELREYDAFYYDPRITHVAEDDCYYLNFAVHSDEKGVRGGQVKTRDFSRFQWIGFGTQPDCRNCVLFPDKFDGLYTRFDRPHANDGQNKHIWLSQSPDLVFWGKSRLVAKTRRHYWDDAYIGPGTVPIKTAEGWLSIYHGVYRSCSGMIYRLGVMMHDLCDPARVLGRCSGYVLGPRAPYERIGDVPNVVFAVGSVLEDDGTVKLYYGAADTVMCLAEAKLEELVRACTECR